MTKKLTLTLLLTLTVLSTGSAQEYMTLSDAIHTARTQSVEALEAKQAFISTYWAYRSYKASRLPSVYMYGNLMNFDRSLTLLQNPEDGTLKYVSSNNLQNGAGLEINQNITFTGGTLSVSSDLSRIDQFGGNKSLTWYSRPVTVSYYQPLFTYNQFKWDKKIEPKAYEEGRSRINGSGHHQCSICLPQSPSRKDEQRDKPKQLREFRQHAEDREGKAPTRRCN